MNRHKLYIYIWDMSVCILTNWWCRIMNECNECNFRDASVYIYTYVCIRGRTFNSVDVGYVTFYFTSILHAQERWELLIKFFPITLVVTTTKKRKHERYKSSNLKQLFKKRKKKKLFMYKTINGCFKFDKKVTRSYFIILDF